MNVYYIAGYPVSNELYHHGIKGQQWGVQNGPPYPIGAQDHSKSEKKAGWRSSLDKDEKSEASADKQKFQLTDGQKKAIAVGAMALGAVYLEYKVGAISSTVRVADHLFEGNPRGAVLEVWFNYSKTAKGNDQAKVSLETYIQMMHRNMTAKKDEKTGLYLKSNDTSVLTDAKAVNPDFDVENPNTSRNCGYCSMAYDLRRRGYDVMAGHGSSGMARQDVRAIYSGAIRKPRYGDYAEAISKASGGMSVSDAQKVLNSFSKEKGTRGIVFVSWSRARGGHAMCYEVLPNGTVAIVDPQVGAVYTGREAVRLLRSISSMETYRTDNIKPNIKKMKELNLIM